MFPCLLSSFYPFLELYGFYHWLQVPHVTRTDYQLLDITEDGFVSKTVSNLVLFVLILQSLGVYCLTQIVFQVSLLTDSGDTKDDLKLPTDDALLKQVFIYSMLLHAFICIYCPCSVLFK